jgi:hypothetical protein
MSEIAWYRLRNLYRSILRKHQQCLPLELRVLGDQYVAEEFRRMREFLLRSQSQTASRQLSEFLEQWQMYLESVGPEGLTTVDVEPALWQQLSPEQRLQLERLRATATTRGEGEAPASVFGRAGPPTRSSSE